MSPSEPDDVSLLRSAADHLEGLVTRTPGGTWEITGLLASRPEVVARYDDGSSEHVADARAGSVTWIVGLAPAVVATLPAWLRSSADAIEAGRLPDRTATDAVRFAAALLDR